MKTKIKKFSIKTTIRLIYVLLLLYVPLKLSYSQEETHSLSFRLSVAEDLQKEFKSQGEINRRLFLAIRRGDAFQIIDGSHRIVRLACDGDFYNKTDFGVVVHRHDLLLNEPTIYIQKMKFKHFGKIGHLQMCYEYKTGRISESFTDFRLPRES